MIAIRCAECGKLVERPKSYQRYCSTRCSQVVNTRTYRERNAEKVREQDRQTRRVRSGWIERDCRLCGRHISAHDTSKSDVCQTCWSADRSCDSIRTIEFKLAMCLRMAKMRAAEKGMEFNLTEDDLLPLPVLCPILDIPLAWTNLEKVVDDSPTLDRKDNSRGYVADNVWWVSHMANTMKRNADPETLLRFANWVMKTVPNSSTLDPANP